MIDRISAAWSKFGEEAPHFSVLTNELFKPENIEKNLEVFYASGVPSIDVALKTLDRNGIKTQDLSTAIDFGCGVGRLTLAMAKQFNSVVGLDISEQHLNLARDQAKRTTINNVDFRRIRSIDDIYSIEPVDFILSLIVLQHNPPPIIAEILRALLSKINAGGAAFFQVPTFEVGYSFNVKQYLSGSSPQLEMNVLPQRDIFAIIDQAGCRVLEVREDTATGSPRFVSNRFLVSKR